MSTTTSLGAEFDPLGAHLANPYPFYARARREEPIFFSPRLGMWVLTRFADIHEVLLQPEVFSSANALRPLVRPHPEALAELGGDPASIPPGVTSSDGEVHDVRRAAVVRALAPTRVGALTGYSQELAGQLVDAFVADGRADLMKQLVLPLPAQVLGRLLNLDEGDAEKMRALADEGVDTFIHEDAPDQIRSARALRELQGMTAAYVQRRRQEPGDDLISQMIATLVPGEGPLTFEQTAHVAQPLLDIVVAGHMTTSDATGTAIRNLLTHRDQWELLCADPDLIPGAVEELVRYDGPVQGFPRVAVRPAQVAGRDFPPGTEFLLLYASANRDEDLYENAAELDVRRGARRHLGFGHGVHACVGAPLGRQEIETVLRALVTRLPSLRLADDQAFPLRPSILNRGLRELHVEWDPAV